MIRHAIEKTLSIIFTTFLSVSGYGFTILPARILSTDTINSCKCPPENNLNQGPQYIPALNNVTKYHILQEITGWTYSNGSQEFESLFAQDYRPYYGSRSSLSIQFTLVSPREQIRLTHPDKTFGINFTPCRVAGYYKLGLTLSYEHKIKDELPDFEYKGFQNTTLNFVHLLLRLSEKRPDEIIKNRLKDLTEQFGFSEINKSIEIMNREYKTGIPLIKENQRPDTAFYDAVIDSLVAKKLKQENVITTAFVLSEPGVHKVTYDENYKLYLLFNKFYRYFSSAEDFERENLRPNVKYVMFESSAIDVEISPGVLKNAGQKAGDITPFSIRKNIAPNGFSTANGLELDMTSVCLPLATISGTAIKINFSDAQLIDHSNSSSSYLDTALYPQFATAGNKPDITGGKSRTIPYDSLLTNFTGIRVNKAGFFIPIGKSEILSAGYNLLINNKFIAGTITLPIAKENSNYLIVDGNKKTIAVKELIAALKKTGITVETTRAMDSQFNVYFKKMAYTPPVR